MNRLGLYRALIRLLPKPAVDFRVVKQRLPDESLQRFRAVLRRHRARDGALAFFDQDGISDFVVYGEARRGVKVWADTPFRLASVSKLVTAAGILAMAQKGLLDLDADADTGLPYSLRHPQAKERPVTLRMLLTHTAGIRDGAAYTRGLTDGSDAASLLTADSHTAHLPGEGCEYSNFGVGLAGCAVEAQTGLSFERAMQTHLFEPLGLNASYYPQRVRGLLADARRVLPPRRRPNFDARARQAAPDAGWDAPDPLRHHLLAHGGCCMDVLSLAKLGQALLLPVFLDEQTLQNMRTPQADLSARDPHLKLGPGLFILEDPDICDFKLYGHQGMAYGAVHMLFMDVKTGRGLISLTTGASEAREYIIADVNRALLREWVRHG